jgi:hypothetical protein
MHALKEGGYSSNCYIQQQLTSMRNLYNQTVTIDKNTNTVGAKVHGDHKVFGDNLDVALEVRRTRCFNECFAFCSSFSHAFGPRAFAFRLGTTNQRHANNTSLILRIEANKEREKSVSNEEDANMQPSRPTLQAESSLFADTTISHSFLCFVHTTASLLP